MKVENKRMVMAGISVLVLAGCVQLACAIEETGKIIEKLVAEVDKQLTSLEELTDKQAPEKERLKNELEKQYAIYDVSEDSMDKATLRGEIVNLLAKLNSADRKEVSATLNTVVNVADALRQIDRAARNSAEFNPDTMKEQKVRISRFVKNAARVVKIMERSSNDLSARNRTVALKNSLIMLYTQLQDPLTGTADALARIQETTRTLEDVAVQLHILQGLLENERVMLITATHVQTVDLALLRLARARLGSDTVANIPGRKHEEIIKRIRRARKPVTDSPDSLVGSSQPYDIEAWEMILAGDL